MPVGAFVPSRIHLDYPEWQAPLIGNIGQVWAYDGTGYVPTSFLPSSAVSAYGLTLIDDADASAARQTLGVVIGTDVQAYDVELAAIAGLTSAADRLPYFTGSGTASLATFTSFGRNLVDDADATAARTTLGLGTAALYNVGTSANNIVQLDGSARLPAVDGSQLTGITVAAAGSTTQVIYNNAGVYAGHSGMTYNSANSRLTVAGGLVAPGMRPASDSTTALGWFDASGTQFVYGDTTNKRFGIGTIPAYKLDISGGQQAFRVVSNTHMDVVFQSASLSQAYIVFQQLSTQKFLFGMDAVGNFKIRNQGLSSDALFVSLSTNYIGIGMSSGLTALLDLAASTTTRASLRIRAGTAPTTPNAGDIWDDGALVAYNIDATTNAVVNSLKLRRGSSGTPAAGFGLGVAARLESSTTEDQDAGRLTWEWATVTHASRASRGKLSAYYTTTEQAAMTWDGDAGGLKLAFYPGVTPVARQLLATGAGATVDDVIQALQNLGLLKQS